jgi:hypothetical protein
MPDDLTGELTLPIGDRDQRLRAPPDVRQLSDGDGDAGRAGISSALCRLSRYQR